MFEEKFLFQKCPNFNQSVNLYSEMCCLCRSRTLTRGSNKGAKEDLKSSLEKQVARASESIESILRLFFIEEKNSLV